MPDLPALQLPAQEFHYRTDAQGREQVYDALRQKYVRLTPEEWVRQHFIQLLIQAQAVPSGLITIEQAFPFQGMTRRADIVAYDRQAQPWLLVECKAPSVPVTQDVFDQAARYNTVVRAPYLIVTNGLDHYCCHIDHANQAYDFLDAFPIFGT